MSGKFIYEGKEYLGASASDPVELAWMRGSPPPEDKRIRFEDDEFLKFPQNRWTLSHIRELMPTVNVWRGERPASALGARPSDMERIDQLTFKDMDGASVTWAESLPRTYTDGILVLHRGKRIYERYFGALEAHRPHACFSITKSYAATLAAKLVHEGVLDERALIPHYLPEMANSAYKDATLRQVMDMQVGVRYSEDYADRNADIWVYGRAGGLRPRPNDYAGPGNFYDYLVTLRKEGAHGVAFDYKTINTEVMCWIMARVTGIPLAQMLSDQIWSRLGCEQDAYITVDSIGVAMGGAGLNATLRDLARFGELMRLEGSWQGEQVLPAAVIAKIRAGAEPDRFAKAGYNLLPGYSYRDMWWVAPPDKQVVEGRGIHGQRLYIAPKAEMVIARFASHPIATSAANDPVTLPAFAALCRQFS